MDDKKLLLEFGKRVSAKRKSLGITQETLAEKMDMSIQMISSIENGKKSLKITNLLKLSKALDISIDYLLTGEHSTSDNHDLLNKIKKLDSKSYKLIELIIDNQLND